MNFHTKLSRFFANKGLTQIEIAEKIQYSQVMVSKYLNKNAPNFDLIIAISKAFPDIDWNHMFKENILKVKEEEEDAEKYKNRPEKLIEEIEVRLNELKNWHKSDPK